MVWWSPSNVTNGLNNYSVLSQTQDSGLVRNWDFSLGVHHNDGDALRGILGNGVDDVFINSGAVLTAGVMGLSVFTGDGTSLRLYHNGALVAGPVAQDNNAGSAGTLRIGSSLWSDNRSLCDAIIASARIYNRTPLAAEIQYIYQSTKVEPYSDIAMRPRRSYKAAAAAGVAPTSHLYGPLVGPLGGAV
jgi:hypothetical protein